MTSTLTFRQATIETPSLVDVYSWAAQVTCPAPEDETICVKNPAPNASQPAVGSHEVHVEVRS